MTTLDDRAVITPGMGVTLGISDRPDPVFGVVLNVYINAAGIEVAEIALPSRPKRPEIQATRFLKAVTA